MLCLNRKISHSEPRSELPEVPLNGIGFNAEPLDLKATFYKTEELRSLLSLGRIWVSSGMYLY